jgi:hypothetical protein
VPGFLVRASLGSSSVGVILFVVFIIFAAIFLLAFAFVIANATFFLTAVLFVIAILLPIVAPIFASVVSHNYVYVVCGR